MNFDSLNLVSDIVLNVLWQAGCLSVATAIVLVTTRNLQLATRKLALGLLLVAWLVLPVWSLVAVPLNLSVGTIEMTQLQERGVPQPRVLSRPELLAVESTWAADAMASPKVESANRLTLHKMLRVAGLLWALGIAVGLCRLFLDQLALSRVLRNLKPVNHSHVVALWSEATEEIPERKRPTIHATSEIETPFSTGWLHPKVVLPHAAINRWSDDELFAAMSHELAHWRQRDLLSCRLQRFVQIIHWWNPAVRILNRKLCHVQEVVCDTIAVHAGSSQRTYANLLIKIAENLRGPSTIPNSAVGMARNLSSLEQRIRTITSKETTMKSIEMKRRNVILACTTACCLALPIFGVQMSHANDATSADVREVEDIDAPTFEKRSPDTKGVAEITIRENGVTRSIRVPLNDEVRGAKIDELFEKMKQEMSKGETRSLPHQERDLAFFVDEDVEHVSPPDIPAPPPAPGGRFHTEDGATIRFNPGSSEVEINERRVEIGRDGKVLNWTAKVDPGADVLFAPEEVEVEVRKAVERAQDQIRRSEEQVEVILKEQLARMQEQQSVQRRTMEESVKQQQQQLQKMMEKMQRQMEELSRENERIRKQLRSTGDVSGDSASN